MELNGAIETSVSSATARINGLSPNTDYEIRVRAKKGTNIGEWSDSVTVKTLLMTLVITNVPSDTEVTLNWTEIPGATSYEVEADGVVVTASGLSYKHTGLASGTNVYNPVLVENVLHNLDYEDPFLLFKFRYIEMRSFYSKNKK